MVWNLVAGLGISFGARLLGGLFGGGRQTTSQINEQGFVSDLTQPASQYGAHIPRVWGNTRITGNMVWCAEPQERVDQWDTEQVSGGSRTITTNRQAYYYGHAVWVLSREISSFRRVWANDILIWEKNTPDDNIHPEQKAKYFSDPNLPLNSGSIISPGLDASFWNGDGTNPAFLDDRPYGWNDRAVVQLEELFLGQFNNSYPAIAVETYRETPFFLSEIITDLMVEAGYEPEQFEVGELDDIFVRGFRTTSADSTESYLRQLQQAYFFEYFESNGKIKFIKILRPSVAASIPIADCAAHEAGGQVPDEAVQVEVTAEDDLPSRVELSYISIFDSVYERKTILSPPVRVDRENIFSVNLEISLADSDAEIIANRLLQLAWSQRRTYKFSLPPKYGYLEPGDVVALPWLGDGPQQVQITRTDWGANGLIKIEARSYNPTVFNGAWVSAPSEPEPPPGGGNFPGNPGTGIPPIVPTALVAQELEANGIGLFISADPGWVGAQLFYARDDVDYFPLIFTKTLSTSDGGSGFLLTGFYGKFDILPSDVGETLYFKAVSVGQDIDDVTAVTIVPTGLGLRGAITGFSPSQGPEETEISIYGYGFITATGAEINGTAITSFVVVDDGTITGIVAVGTTTGKIVVATPAGDITSITDFSVVEPGIDWGQIGGQIREQLDLQDRFNRIRRYTNLIGDVTIPSVGGTVNVTLEDPDGFAPTVPVCLFRTDSVGSGSGYAQMLCIGRTGNVLTLERDATGLVTQTNFLDGDIIAPIVDREVNIYGGLSVISGTATKSKNIESISTTKSLILTSEYFQFLTPTAASVAVQLPAVTGSDYFEGEIINAGDGTNALEVQESDATPIITLSTADLIRSIYYYWDGSIWRIFERNVYD
ncbi:hypothetical protein H6G45_09300 [Synechocystis sp. FACHB-383]|uniref:phage tail protein n=1 Tax=Synechocystis sp. FACHB-383 TaxID=2692864 RepID=UPI0016866FD6|nr:phage tail protein [Synechocystis sp. FACHB-383]MBD2653682.1 hypothetical protein [Synechocystis sp. FACHB-383]